MTGGALINFRFSTVSLGNFSFKHWSIMKAKLLFALILSTVLVMTGCNSTQTEDLISVATADVNLGWEECPIPNDSKINGVDISQVKTCFNLSLPLLTAEERDNFGIAQINGLNTELYTYNLTIGDDLYETKMTDFSPSNMEYKYTLSKNGETIQSFSGKVSIFAPMSLQNIGGKAAWEVSDFSDHSRHAATIFYDGIDMQKLYGLDKAHHPYGINEKLIFIGEKDNKYFIVYDGKKVGSDFDKVRLAHVAEPTPHWSVQYGNGMYLFWGFKNEQWYIIKITSLQNSDG